MSDKQLREDLELLWVCGLPGYGPGDLIDMAFDGDRVTITYDAGIDRPLRLNQDEALALVVALRMLAQVPGVHDREAVERALAKIESAGRGRRVGLPVAAVVPDAATERLAELQGAVARRRALRMTYYTRDPGRDHRAGGRPDAGAPGRRPGLSGGAWCRRAEAVRLFRVDRIDSATELDEPSAPPPTARRTDVSDGVFTAQRRAPGDHVADRLGGARWITEYYPVRERDRGDHRAGGWCRCGRPPSPGPAGWP